MRCIKLNAINIYIYIVLYKYYILLELEMLTFTADKSGLSRYGCTNKKKKKKLYSHPNIII